MKIRNRINIGYLSTYVAIMSLVGLIVGLYATSVIKDDIYAYFQSSNRARAEHIRTYIQDQQRMSEILAAASVYLDFLSTPETSTQFAVVKAKIDKRFVRTIKVDPTIKEVFILDRAGKVLASSDKNEERADKSRDPYYLNAKDNTYFKDVYLSSTTHEFNYTISTPIKDAGGNLLGISVLRFSPENFFSITGGENGLGDSEENFLINREKYFLTPSRFYGESAILKQQARMANASDCFDPAEVEYVRTNGYSGLIKKFGSQIVEAKDYRNVDVIATHSYIPETGWCLITKADQADIYSFKFWLILIFSITFSIAALAFLALGLIISRRITKPIQILSQAAKKIEQGDFAYQTNIKSDDEIGVLAKAFDKMVGAVKRSRLEIEKKVKDQTREISAWAQDLEKQKSAMLNILEDVDAEKSRSEALAHDLEKFRLAVENTSDHILITDKDATVLYMNKGAQEITGFTPKEVLGKKSGSRESWGGLMPKDFYVKMWQTIKTDKKVFKGELDNKRKNGELYTANVSISPILNDAGEVEFFVALERDITKEKQIDRAKTEFVSLASHQLRTPLSAINWYAEMLLDGDAGVLNKDQKQYVGEIYSGNQRMVDLVNALLNVSRIELGTVAVEPVDLDLIKEAKSVVGELRPQIMAKKQVFTENYEKSLPTIKVDQKLTRIVLQNLLSNAVKYTPDGGKVDLSLKVKGKDVLIEVKDTGYGIPLASQSKIFDKLYRADNVREKDTEGTGLGLYLVKSVVETSGGKVWFESVENKGTTFYATLPLAGMKKKAGSKSLEQTKY